MKDWPRCYMCSKESGIMDREVSTFRLVRGQGYDLVTTMLCRECEDKITSLVWKTMRADKSGASE